MPCMGAYSERSSSEDSPNTQAVRQKTKFCMYHLQGVCKFAGGGCAYAHSTEEMRQGRTKTRRGQGPPAVSVQGGRSQHARSNQYDASDMPDVDGFGYQEPMLVQPFPYHRSGQDLGQKHLAFTSSQHGFTSQRFQAPPRPQVPVHANSSLVPPPGLEFPQSPPLPHSFLVPQRLTHQAKTAGLADLTQYVADLTQAIDKLADAARMAELTSCRADPLMAPMAPNMPQDDVHALSCFVYGLQHKMMTPPNPYDSAGEAFGPPGLSLSSVMGA